MPDSFISSRQKTSIEPIWLLRVYTSSKNGGVQREVSQIEVFFRTLKSSCRIEQRRFDEIDRVLNCVAFYCIVAWRLMYICHLGRECPDMDCEIIFEPSEWKSVYVTLGIPLPAEGCPKLNEVVRAIARLGGFIDRPKNDPGTNGTVADFS